MKVCLVSPGDEPGGEGDLYRRLAELLAPRHQVVLIEADEAVAEASGEIAKGAFASEDHRRSAAVLEAIERAYGSAGPGYLETCDRGALGLVPLLARRAGHAALGGTRFGVRLTGSTELTALSDGCLRQPDVRRLCDLEREQLRLADRIVWPGGSALEVYRRYPAIHLPEAVCIPVPPDLPAPSEGPERERRDSGEPLRILYCGELRRSRGALDLAEACLRLPRDDWELTMIGADTPTAGGGQSIGLTIEAMFGGDPRLRLEEAPPAEEMRRRWSQYDLLIAPPRFDVWPREALRAMAFGLPVLATPVGGLTEVVEVGRTGWLAEDIGPTAIRRSLADLLARRDDLERVHASGEVVERIRRLADPAAAREGYERLFEEVQPVGGPVAVRGTAPLVSAVIPYHRASAYVEEAVDSLFAQSYSNLEAIVINDGSFEAADDVLAGLAGRPGVRVVTQLHSGEVSARNLGADLARGEYLLMLDADNVLEPAFVARALAVFARQPDLPYVSCWLRFIAPDGSPHLDPAGYAALGNSVVGDDVENWDGDNLALLPRRLFAELGYRYESAATTHADWEFYRRLREDGKFGVVIPEFLARYRVRPDSLQRSFGEEMQARAWGEALDRQLEHVAHWAVGA